VTFPGASYVLLQNWKFLASTCRSLTSGGHKRSY
jgi:hypothetical protein